MAVIHCKAGKGRTGVMICSYLVHCGMWTETQVRWFAEGNFGTVIEISVGCIGFLWACANQEWKGLLLSCVMITSGTLFLQGVTIPSQVRYVHYYSKLFREKKEYQSVPLLLTKVTLHGMPNFSNGTCGL